MKESLENQIGIISAGVESILPFEELKTKLLKKNILKIKLGADPTAPDLHLGHAVVLQKMKDFQDLGHEVIFLIGDFTTLIGDPTGKSKTRPALSKDEIAENAKTYFEQVFKILDQNKTTVVFNSSWLEKLSAFDFVKLCAKTTIMQLLEREDFKNRINNKISVGFHELLYPILQAYDSVELKVDVELGGTEQTFNLMFGRTMQEQFGQKPQVVITLPLLEGLDGEQKMSKSLGNYVGLKDSAEDAFGKLMSMPDKNILNYHKILLRKDEAFLQGLVTKLKSGEAHPKVEKKALAFEILSTFWGAGDAEKGQAYFEEIYENQNYEKALPLNCTEFIELDVWIVDLLKKAKITNSSSDAKRLIQAGSVYLNEIKITEFKYTSKLINDSILKVGKKVFKLILVG